MNRLGSDYTIAVVHVPLDAEHLSAITLHHPPPEI